MPDPSPDSIFHPSEPFGALRCVSASEADTGGCRIAVRCSPRRITLDVGVTPMAVNFDLTPAAARALAAELVASAEAAERAKEARP